MGRKRGERDAEAEGILYKALGTEHGIVVSSPRVTGGLQRLYRARSSAFDPALSALSFRRPPRGEQGEIWIVKTLEPSPDPSPDLDLGDDLGP